jgi:hypothetical protein
MIYGQGLSYPYESFIILIDTERERQISAGARYKFDAMKEGECYVNIDMADRMGVTIGDVIYNRFDLYQNLAGLVKEFNKVAYKLGESQINVDEAV